MDSVGETDVVCTAMNAGVLDGLITVFHTERSADSLANLQNDLPVLCAEDKAALEARAPRPPAQGYGRGALAQAALCLSAACGPKLGR